MNPHLVAITVIAVASAAANHFIKPNTVGGRLHLTIFNAVLCGASLTEFINYLFSSFS